MRAYTRLWRLSLILGLALGNPCLAGAQKVEAVRLPGFSAPAWGRWLGPKDNQSGVPLGGMGTGFVELRSDGRFYDTVLQNDWTQPKATPGCGLDFTAGKLSATLLGSSTNESTQGVYESPRYFGHYPMADLQFRRPTELPVSVWIRAYAPFVPQDTVLSNTPANLYSVVVRNEGKTRLTAGFTFWWTNDLAGARRTVFKRPGVSGARAARIGSGSSYAIAAKAAGWNIRPVPALGGGASGLRLEASASLRPGEERRITFTFAWYVATWRLGEGKLMMNRYAARFKDAQTVAEFAIARSEEIEKQIIGWQSRFYARDLPAWLKDALVNGLASLARNTLWLDDGRLIVSDSLAGRGATESLACRSDGSLPLLLLFPEQEKRTMREFARLQKANGEIPPELGIGPKPELGIGPGPDSPLAGRERLLAPGRFALLAYRDWLWTHDAALLRELYPAAKRGLTYMMTMDTDGDGLINEQESPGDPWPWYGTSAYSAGIGLAALRAGEEMAKETGDSDFAVWCRVRFDRGTAAYEEDLWTGQCYRLYTDPDHFRQTDSCYVDQLCGQQYAWLCDLGDLHPAAHTAIALRTIAALNGQATAWGVVNCCKTDGSADTSGGSRSADIAIAEVWNYATSALMAGRRLDSAELMRIGLLAGERAYNALVKTRMLWNQHSCHSAADAHPLGIPHHSGSLSVWALPFGYDGVALRPKPVAR